MQGQEGRVDRVPGSGDGWCPGLFTSSSVSSSSLFSPSSPSRVRRGIKAQLLRGMQGGGGGGKGREGWRRKKRKQSAKSLSSDDTCTFLPASTCFRSARWLGGATFSLIMIALPSSPTPNNHISPSPHQTGISPPLSPLHSPFTFSSFSSSSSPPSPSGSPTNQYRINQTLLAENPPTLSQEETTLAEKTHSINSDNRWFQYYNNFGISLNS